MKQVERVIAAGTLNVAYSNARLVKHFGVGFFCTVLSTSWKNLVWWSFPAESECSKAPPTGMQWPTGDGCFLVCAEKRLHCVWKCRNDQRAPVTFLKESISICFYNSSFRAVYLFGCSAFRLGFFSELLTFVTMWLLEEIALQCV